MERSPQDNYFASMAQPLEVVDEASAHTTTSSANVTEKKKPKLLLVEDNEINLQVNRRTSLHIYLSCLLMFSPRRGLTIYVRHSFLAPLREEVTSATTQR